MRNIDAARALVDATAGKVRAHDAEVTAINAAKARGLNHDAILADAAVRLAVRDYQRAFGDFIRAEIALYPPSRRPKRGADETAPF